MLLKNRTLRLWQAMLSHIWYIDPPLTLPLTLSPGAAFQVLGIAAKPSTQRLHLRELFASGRRYAFAIQAENRFSMMTTSKVSWHPRRRTHPTVRLVGQFEGLASGSKLALRAHARPQDWLMVWPWPIFITSLILPMPWEGWFIGLCMLGLFACAWLAHRNGAALEAHEMLYFVERALAEYIVQPAAPLAEGGHVVIETQHNFEAAWARFYEHMQRHE